MKRLLLFSLLFFCALAGFARHLKGGFFTYTYLGQTATTISYHVTLTVYMECNAAGMQIDQNISFTFYEANTNQLEKNVSVPISETYLLQRDQDEKCISGDQRGCYYKIVVYDLSSVTLPLSANGYTVSYQRCCRIEDINNVSGSGSVGNTYSITIPGTGVAPGAETNNSAKFEINDTYVVCGGNPFEYPFFCRRPRRRCVAL